MATTTGRGLGAHPLTKALPWLGLWIAVTLAIALRCWNFPQCFFQGHVYFVDADCYSRMTRVQQVMASPWRSIRFHDFENAPFGTVPHTTAPMDLAIAVLARILQLMPPAWMAPGGGLLDMAGAWISPLLGGLLVGFLCLWGRMLALPFRTATVILAGISPILVHGFLLGRPDHQSLVVLLAGSAVACELALWLGRAGPWRVASAALWALALWTSLFEPLILLVTMLALRFAVRGRSALPGRVEAGVFLAILLVAILFDGWRNPLPKGTGGEEFLRWSRSIGELQHLALSQLFSWTGWLLVIAPALLIARAIQQRMRPCAALAGLLILLSALSLWHARWGYFLALVFALSLPFCLAAIPWKPAAWFAFAISLWPVASEWERTLFPDETGWAARRENLADMVLLREAVSMPPGSIVLAPWWLSPAITYWSGSRGVAGSSHQSLPGILDSARFYLSPHPEAARSILIGREVDYVIAYEPARVLGNSSQILGARPAGRTTGEILYTNPSAAPDFLRLVFQNKFYKVFKVLRPAKNP